MSDKHPECNVEKCVLDVLEPVFGKESGIVAISATCYPLDCTAASVQAKEIVKVAEVRLKAGWTMDNIVTMAITDAEESFMAEAAKLDNQRDACEFCGGTKGGVPGNENIVDGKLMCDDCHVEHMKTKGTL